MYLLSRSFGQLCVSDLKILLWMTYLYARNRFRIIVASEKAINAGFTTVRFNDEKNENRPVSVLNLYEAKSVPNGF